MSTAGRSTRSTKALRDCPSLEAVRLLLTEELKEVHKRG